MQIDKATRKIEYSHEIRRIAQEMKIKIPDREMQAFFVNLKDPSDQESNKNIENLKDWLLQLGPIGRMEQMEVSILFYADILWSLCSYSFWSESLLDINLLQIINLLKEAIQYNYILVSNYLKIPASFKIFIDYFQAADAKYKEIRLSTSQKIPTYYEKRRLRFVKTSSWVEHVHGKKNYYVYQDFQHYKLIQKEIRIEYDGTESFGPEIVVIF